MWTSHARCLLCLNDHREKSDVHVCRHLNLCKTPVTAVCMFELWMSAFVLELLSRRQPEHPLLVLSSLMQVVFLVSLALPPVLPGSLLRLALTLHTDCRSFTSCQGESAAGRWRAGQSHCATPAQVRWVQAIHDGAGRLSTIYLPPLKNLSLSAETSAGCDLAI